MSSKQVVSFSVKDLLADLSEYAIPMYQRNYAWGETEIGQLLHDINDYWEKSTDKTYYLGTLVVYQRKDGSLEVIDGQQRFTTLTLLSIALKSLAAQDCSSIDMAWYQRINLSFEARPRSSKTLEKLFAEGSGADLESDDYSQAIVAGFSLLKQLLENQINTLKDQHRLEDFFQYLFERVCIVRVQVPANTDLNHYFEVMNTRGEQLEMHEVLKARLMSRLHALSGNSERDANIHVLATVWDAVSNMERYVQYGFGTTARTHLFGECWGEFKAQDFRCITKALTSVAQASVSSELVKHEEKQTLAYLLETKPEKSQTDSGGGSDKETERFSSISNFPNFLLHVLRVYTREDIALDDKQLLDKFDEHLLKDSTLERLKGFIFALLKAKYLFDHYIIKREFLGESDNGWSLQRLHYYSHSRSQSYLNTFSEERLNHRILMLLSAFHVSTPTQSYKYWLNGALNILYRMEDITAQSYLAELESMARVFTYGRYLASEPREYYSMIYGEKHYTPVGMEQLLQTKKLKYGGIENNFVFNYLDYLLWCREGGEKSSDKVVNGFRFTARSSVEHFYPQNPQDNHGRLGIEHLHSFGNLCLIEHGKNSRISNFQPENKYSEFYKTELKAGKIDSLKIHEMIKLMNKSHSDKKWWEAEIQRHQESMLMLFVEDSIKGQKEWAASASVNAKPSYV